MKNVLGVNIESAQITVRCKIRNSVHGVSVKYVAEMRINGTDEVIVSDAGKCQVADTIPMSLINKAMACGKLPKANANIFSIGRYQQKTGVKITVERTAL